MKFLLIMIMLWPSFVFANWVKKSEVKNPVTIWAKKNTCQSQEGEDCVSITGKDLRRWKMGQVDDLDKPNLRAAEDSPVKVDCNDFLDCRNKALDPNGDSNFDDNVCLIDNSSARWDELANWPGITGVTGPWFIWCEKEDGTYQQKDVLVNDAPGSVAADAEDLDKENERVARIAAKGPREVSLQTCVQDTKNPTLSPAQIKACVGALVRELLGEKVNVGDL